MNEPSDTPADLPVPADDGRDPSTGRFLPGNTRGGNPNVARLAAAQAEMRAHVKPGDVDRVLTKLRTRAELGDVQAAKVWLDRVLGRVTEAPPAALLAIPALTDAAAIAQAHVIVAQAITDGSIDLETGGRLVDVLGRVGGAVSWADVARQLAELVQTRGAR